MTDTTSVTAVYALARTQLDWIPDPPPTLEAVPGFAHGAAEDGRQLRWLSCPDCLTNGRAMFGCETCGGRGEVPDEGRDPYERTGTAPFFGEEDQQQRDRARMIDGQLIRLKQLARAREGDQDAIPEDWLTRALRLKDQQWRRGDYGLLEQWQELLGYRYPMRHLAWASFVVDQQPLRATSVVVMHLDETAAWLADRMLSSIAFEIAKRRQQQLTLGVDERRLRLRPAAIVVPPEHRDPADTAAGKGRWANGHTQSNRNATIVGLAAEGKTAGEIARTTGLKKRRVQQILASELVVHEGGPGEFDEPMRRRTHATRWSDYQDTLGASGPAA